MHLRQLGLSLRQIQRELARSFIDPPGLAGLVEAAVGAVETRASCLALVLSMEQILLGWVIKGYFLLCFPGGLFCRGSGRAGLAIRDRKV
jgi:hypothetical protein